MAKAGFTLLEMLFSLLIIAIIMMFVSANVLAVVRASQVKNGARQVVASLEYARSCALASKEEAKLVFTEDGIGITCRQDHREIKIEQVSITTNFPKNTAVFNQSGVVNQGASINVCNQSGCQQVTIGIGRSDVQIK